MNLIFKAALLFLSAFPGMVFSAGITVTSPDGGELWARNTVKIISWDAPDTIPNVRIEFSLDGGISWEVVIPLTPNDYIYAWPLPDTISEKCLIRVSSTPGPGGLSDTSNGVFTIGEPYISVTAPNGGWESWLAGTVHAIGWASDGDIDSVEIAYSSDGGFSWKVLSASVPNSGIFFWTVPDDTSSACLVRVQHAQTGSPSDVSDQLFKIAGAMIFITSPDGSEYWEPGSREWVTWFSAGIIPSVKIEYTADGGSSWTEIVASTPNSGSYEWPIPEISSGRCKIRVRDASDDFPVDSSTSFFTIAQPPSLTLTFPNGGEMLKDTAVISWNFTGIIRTVRLAYSADGGSEWHSIISTTPNTGRYIWVLPQDTSSTGIVRISETVNGAPEDVSDSVFSMNLPILEIRPRRTTAPEFPGISGRISQGNMVFHFNCFGNERVKIEVFGTDGASVGVPIDGFPGTGSHRVVWEVPKGNGPYFLKMEKESCGPGSFFSVIH